MTNTAWIIPVHNRREVTLACLQRLRNQGVLEWSQAYVVDDGSTDGTSDAIRAAFPEVRLLHGDGDLWWTGATEHGMRAAFDDGAQFICWLNDDTSPHAGACAQLRTTSEATGAITTGQCQIPANGPIVYGGLRKKGMGLHVVPVVGHEPVEVHAACGNFVCIPRSVVERIGFVDGRHLPHAHGDTDYTLRASSAGFRVLVEPRALADARPNALANYTSWLLSDISVPDIWRPLADKRAYAFAPAYARLLSRHFGFRGSVYWVWTIIKRVPISLLRLLIPQSWLRRWWGNRSVVWQEEQSIRSALARSGR
jgi:hypothetical protein